jgi:hypothetical protein
MISRGQTSFQVSKSPQGVSNASKKDKKGRVLSQGKKSVQGVAQRLRVGGTVKVSKGRSRKLGKLY